MPKPPHTNNLAQAQANRTKAGRLWLAGERVVVKLCTPAGYKGFPGVVVAGWIWLDHIGVAVVETDDGQRARVTADRVVEEPKAKGTP
tara:strand:+ start:490 stop:753 length:264 start_codon:yes stop_codon:yes gene_type:complete